MPRILIATVGGIVGLILYVMLATALADVVVPLHWAIQLVFYTVVGVAWVGPMRWLMFWGAGQR